MQERVFSMYMEPPDGGPPDLLRVVQFLREAQQVRWSRRCDRALLFTPAIALVQSVGYTAVLSKMYCDERERLLREMK